MLSKKLFASKRFTRQLLRHARLLPELDKRFSMLLVHSSVSLMMSLILPPLLSDAALLLLISLRMWMLATKTLSSMRNSNMIQLRLKVNSAQESPTRSQMQMLQDWCLVLSRLCSVLQRRFPESSLITQCVAQSSEETHVQVTNQVKTTTLMASASMELTEPFAKLVISPSRELPISSLTHLPLLDLLSTALLTRRSWWYLEHLKNAAVKPVSRWDVMTSFRPVLKMMAMKKSSLSLTTRVNASRERSSHRDILRLMDQQSQDTAQLTKFSKLKSFLMMSAVRQAALEMKANLFWLPVLPEKRMS